MNFSSLVLMEKDKKNNKFIREMGSYEVGDGAEKITKFFYDGEMVNVYFDTGRDVEDWEYSAVFDLFQKEVFEEKGYSIEDVDEEYNPAWHVKFSYSEDNKEMTQKLNNLCDLIDISLNKVFEDIKDKKDCYINL